MPLDLSMTAMDIRTISSKLHTYIRMYMCAFISAPNCLKNIVLPAFAPDINIYMYVYIYGCKGVQVVINT